MSLSDAIRHYHSHSCNLKLTEDATLELSNKPD